MSSDVLSVSPSETIERAAQMMVERRVGSAVVVKNGDLQGILTERDILRAVARGLVPWNTEVVDCMTATPVTVSSQDSSEDALRLMRQGDFRHLPVLDDGTLTGIVSLRDIVSKTKHG